MNRPVISSRNRHQWQEIALFLDAMPKRKPAAIASTPKGGQAQRRTPAGAGLVALQAFPDGNHGENLNQAQA